MADWQNRIVDHGIRPASEFTANPKNWRTHPMNQRAAVEGSLNELGWIDTVIVNRRTGYLVDGHERLWQALKAGDDTPVPFIEVDLSEEEEALALASLDPITGMAGADKQKLDELMQEIQTGEAGLQEMLSELAEDNGLYFGEQEEPLDDAGAQIDKAEELRQKWGVESGQMWQLGEHRIICGDCTDKKAVDRVMDGEKANLTVTSPPYFNQRPEYSTFESYEKYNEFLSDVVDVIVSISGDPFVLAWNTGDNQPDCLPMIADQTVMIHSKGLTYLDTIIWKKSGAVYSIPRSAHIKTHNYYYPALAWEPVIIFRIGKNMPKFDKKDANTVSDYGINVWEIQQVNGQIQDNTGHPAMYPEELALRVVMAYSYTGSIIYEPFSGSGTTIIACERLNRKCRAIEISPAYVAVAIQRWVDTTGGEPELVT